MFAIGIDKIEYEGWKEDGGEDWGWLALIGSVEAGKKNAVTRSWTHLLLATLVASSLDARLPLLLVVVATKVVITVGAARAAANHADGAPLALCSAIGTDAGGVGHAMAAGRNRACRAHGGGRTSIAMAMAVLSLGLGCRACGAGSGGCRTVHALLHGGGGGRQGKMGKRGERNEDGGGQSAVCRQFPLPQHGAALAGPSNSPGTLANGSEERRCRDGVVTLVRR